MVFAGLEHGVAPTRGGVWNLSSCASTRGDWDAVEVPVERFAVPFALLGALAYLITGLLLTFVTWLHLRVIYGPYIQVGHSCWSFTTYLLVEFPILFTSLVLLSWTHHSPRRFYALSLFYSGQWPYYSGSLTRWSARTWAFPSGSSRL